MKSYVIGLDIGTTSAKAVLFKRSGYVVAEHEELYPTSQPKIGWSEQDPLQIELATIQALKMLIEKAAVPAADIAAVGLSSAMHSIVCLNADNEPLSPLITWADQRSVKQAEELRSMPGSTIYLKTGTPQHPMTPLVKLRWMKENDYEPYRQATKFKSMKEFLLARWFREDVVDYGVASASGLFNITEKVWEKEALAAAGVTKDQLSTPVPPTYLCQGLPPALADEIGIDKKLPFVVGSSDGPLANIGTGAIHHGDVTVTIGTSGAIRQMSTSPRTDEQQEIFCYSVSDELWVMGGPTNNGGNVLHWMREVLGEEQQRIAAQKQMSAYELLTELAETSSPGANGLLFLPYLNGERAPIWNSRARASFIGLTPSHTKADMLRAGLEGSIYSIYHIGTALNRLAGPPKTMLASGGFSRSALWLQILADVFGQQVQLPLSHQSSAWGAAWIALLATGEEARLEDIKESIPMKGTIEPNEQAHQRYKEMFAIYQQAINELTSTFQRLSALQADLR
ncbi:gluconokinase [Alkalihalobacillus oceani]|uniref:gluconokinase n=1 Tax=Halalkalibacter oceani TaxID=1653776 RepID=UPI0020426BB0|nr:gluconokinase [Halalkalibacter oceani]MCM3759263.1 gluconokinase [Halalkalibacter oceani]